MCSKHKTIRIKRLADLPYNALIALVGESEQVGWRFMRRLIDEWTAGANRFDKPGEALFAASVAERLVGVCGLNVDPYVGDESTGRIRHLYVLSEFRRLGIGRRLVATVAARARGRFTCLRLRTESAEAAAFYERLGFHSQDGLPNCTHARMLTAV